MEKKELLRRKAIEERNQIPGFLRIEKSKQIVKRIVTLEQYHKAESLLLYSAIQSEVHITALMYQAVAEKKRVYFPRVQGEQMEFYCVFDETQLKKGCFGVLEPVEGCEIFKGGRDAFMLVPGTAFSREGDRIGYGKGYYDRYLNQSTGIYACGVCFESQLYPMPDTDKLDYRMDGIVTESRFIACI